MKKDTDILRFLLCIKTRHPQIQNVSVLRDREELGFHYNVLYILDGLENMAALMEATINFYESHRSSSRQARTEQISCQVLNTFMNEVLR